ncbi:TetR family transcriptional regulator [Pilimelia anulata]|uniref:TetR family transcriptional regulator n=1 Tax=Pilimelia anulata TaxID=53371 RepID=A0A8J3F7F4_9ACTN|nr:TetR family transcriptional regulator [Pilimelia anulata]GGJ77980.1 TetR family transcriptional regulator [Pilimelia anulata]
MDEEPPGLRERKKAATRRALSEAALRLALADGIERVTADAIAAEADVSPRTFHNYFSSKEEAVAAAVDEQTRALADDLRDRPEGEPLWDALTEVALRRFADSEQRLADTVAAKRLMHSTPALRAHHYRVSEATERILAEVVAARTGTDVDTDLYPRLLIATVSSAAQTAMQLWASGSSGAASATDLLIEALGLVRAGLPEPGAAPVPAMTARH